MQVTVTVSKSEPAYGSLKTSGTLEVRTSGSKFALSKQGVTEREDAAVFTYSVSQPVAAPKAEAPAAEEPPLFKSLGGKGK